MTPIRTQPSPEEIAHYMKRADHERSAMFATLFGGLWRRLVGRPKPSSALRTSGC